jgi:pimeloyl-ACP methyl ester carboxylesterase
VLSVRAGDLEIAYREAGSGDPVLLVNGTGEGAATWAGLTTRLEGRWRCVAYDARDAGKSTIVDAAYTPRDLAVDAAGVIEGLDLGPVHVVGYSLGGATAQELALARPDLVRSMVLLSTWARSDAWFVAQMRNWQVIRRAAADDQDAFLRALEPWILSPATFDNPPLLSEIRAMWDGDVPDQSADAWVRQCEADIAHDTVDRLGEVRAPALVLVGDDDICTPLRYAEELVELLPDARLVTFPDAGHCAVFERPVAVADAVAAFLGSV